MREKRLKSFDVLFHIRRKLEQNNPQPIFQDRDSFEHKLRFVACFFQSLEVSNSLRRFYREAKVVRHLCSPTLHHAWLRHSIERVVEFDRLQPLSVIMQHVLGGKFLRIKTSLPLFVAVATRADVKVFHHGTIFSRINVFSLSPMIVAVIFSFFITTLPAVS